MQAEVEQEGLYIRRRASDWYRVVETCRRFISYYKKHPEDRTAYRSFIICQRAGIGASHDRYAPDNYLDEWTISCLSPYQLLDAAEQRLARARQAQQRYQEIEGRYGKLANQIRELTSVQTPKAVMRLHEYRKKLDHYNAVTWVEAVGLAIAATINSMLGGSATAQPPTDIQTALNADLFGTDAVTVASSDGAVANINLSAYPDIEVTTTGDIFGPYGQLRAYLRDQGLSRQRGEPEVGYEAHHLLEDRLMHCFGFSRDEGLSVAVYADEHMQEVHGAVGIDFQLPFSLGDQALVYDFWDVIYVHMETYRQIGRSAWADKVRRYALTNRERVLNAYIDGTVIWATPDDIDELRNFYDYLAKLPESG